MAVIGVLAEFLEFAPPLRDGRVERLDRIAHLIHHLFLADHNGWQAVVRVRLGAAANDTRGQVFLQKAQPNGINWLRSSLLYYYITK